MEKQTDIIKYAKKPVPLHRNFEDDAYHRLKTI